MLLEFSPLQPAAEHKLIEILFRYVTNHKTLLLHHNFTIQPSTGVYVSRILSYIYYYELLVLGS